jgi:cytochrome c oxidase assembly protein subunit 15
MIATLALGFALKTTGQAGFQEWALRRQAPVQFWLKTTGAWLICLCATTASVLGLLLVALRRKDPAFWLRWLGTTALAGIIVQGLLGGFRVQFHALFGPDLAALHAVLAQILFAVLAGLAVLTSRSWNQSESEIVPPATPGPRTLFPTLSALLFGLILVQVFLGVLVRHSLWWVGPRGHLLVAFAVVITVFALALAVFTEPRSGPGLRRSTKILVGLIAVQLILGVEAWMGRLAPGGSGDFQAPTMYQAVTRVAHLLVGSWVLAASVVVALTARWPSRDKDCRLPIPNVKIHEEVS